MESLSASDSDKHESIDDTQLLLLFCTSIIFPIIPKNKVNSNYLFVCNLITVLESVQDSWYFCLINVHDKIPASSGVNFDEMRDEMRHQLLNQ